MEIGKFKLAKADLVRPPNKPAQEQIIPKQKPYTEKVFKLEVDDFIKGFIGGFPKDEMLLKIQSVLDKAVDAGAIEPQEGIKYLRERKQQLVDFARENYGQELPGIEDRENFYAGSSLEQFGSKIKDLHLKGTSSPKINELLGFEKDRSTTIDSFIQSMKEGKSPIKITADELSKRPNIKGTNISGKPGERVKDLKKYISDFEKKEGKLPSKAELRAANFDLASTINPAIERGDIEVLPEGESRTRGGYTRTNKELQLLADNQKVLDIFRKGDPSLKDLETIKKVIGPVSDKVAASRILQLANIFANTGVEEARGLNIKPRFKKNALKIIEAADFQPYLRDAYEELIGKSVGEKSIKKIKQEIRGSDLYKQSDLSKFYNIDELLGVTSSVTKGTTPYGIFGQVIEGGINRQEKLQWDAKKSKLELKLQNAIKKFGRNSKQANDVKKEFNKKAKEAEEAINYGKAIGAKKVTLPRISFSSPNSTIANFKDFNKNYKKAFMDNFKEKGYSFEIPKNIRTIPQLRDDIKDPKSSTYKSLINSLKKGFNEYDEKKLFQKLKDATPESIKKNLKFIPRIASLEDDFTGPGGYPLTAGLDPSIGIKPVEEEQEGFVERNPLTTAAAGTTAATGALTGSKLLKSDPLKKPRRFTKQIAKFPLKALGSFPAALYYGGQTVKEGMEEGKSFADAVTEPEVGLELLLPELFKRSGFKIFNPLVKASTPTGVGITVGGTLKNRAQSMMEQAEGITQLPEGEAQRQLIEEYAAKDYKGYYNQGGRVNFKDGTEVPVVTVDDKIDELISFYQDYLKQGGKMNFRTFAKKYIPENFATGGRAGFADGPEDPSKRKFMKIAGGLASLPIIGRFFDIAQVAEKAAPAAVEAIKNAPPHFLGLVNKIRALGRIVNTKELMKSDQDRYSNIYDYGEYRMFERRDGGIEISKDRLMATDYGDAKVSEEYMSYNPNVPKYNKKGEKIPDEFTDEYEEYTAYADQDGKMKDVQDGVEPDTIDDGTYSKEELEQLIIENIKKGEK